MRGRRRAAPRAGLDHERPRGRRLGADPVLGDRRPRRRDARPHPDVRHREPAPGGHRAGPRHDRDAEAPSRSRLGRRRARWPWSASSTLTRRVPGDLRRRPARRRPGGGAGRGHGPGHPERLPDGRAHRPFWPSSSWRSCSYRARKVLAPVPRPGGVADRARARLARSATCSAASSPFPRRGRRGRRSRGAAIEERYSRPRRCC